MKIGIVGSRSRDSEEDYKKIVSEFLKHYTEGDISRMVELQEVLIDLQKNLLEVMDLL